MVPDDVEVVEQPLSGRADVERSRLRRRCRACASSRMERVPSSRLSSGPMRPVRRRGRRCWRRAMVRACSASPSTPSSSPRIGPERRSDRARWRENAPSSVPQNIRVVSASAPARDGSCGDDGPWRVHRGAQWGFEAPVSSRIDLPPTDLSADSLAARDLRSARPASKSRERAQTTGGSWGTRIPSLVVASGEHLLHLPHLGFAQLPRAQEHRCHRTRPGIRNNGTRSAEDFAGRTLSTRTCSSSRPSASSQATGHRPSRLGRSDLSEVREQSGNLGVRERTVLHRRYDARLGGE